MFDPFAGRGTVGRAALLHERYYFLTEKEPAYFEYAQKVIIPTAWAKFTKTSEIDDPLLKVPPARRGNRTRARFPSRSGGNLKEGGK